MDPRVHEFQQILLARGIRLQEDDPLFALLILNELQFDRLAAKHYQAMDKRMIVSVVTSILERQPKEMIKCQVGPDADKAARRLESASSLFANFEGRTAGLAQDVAREAARTVAGKMLTDLTRKIEAELTRLEVLGSQSDKLNDVSKKVLQGAKLIYDESRRARFHLLGLSLSFSFIFGLGMYLGFNFGH